MRIVIDMQGAQTGSRFRGIGRYTTALVRGILRHAGEHEIWLVLNGALEESIDAIRNDFYGLLPAERFQVFECPAPVSDINPRFAARSDAAELIREHFIAQLRPDAVLVTSLFESYFEHAVVSAGRFTDASRTAVILYDLIPFMNQDAYLTMPLARTLYMAKIDSLRRAGLLLSISDYARTEAIVALGLDAARVVSISTAVDESFKPQRMAAPELAAIWRQFGIIRPMLMYAPGGYDKRKNLNGLISAYALLPLDMRASYQLVIASRLTEDNRADLEAHARRSGLRAGEVILTGYVSDPHLIGLYQSAALFIFPSLHEGFGLPALEAMACGAPVIGSNSTSLPEVIGLHAAMFDPASVPAMARKIAEVLDDPLLQEQLRAHGRVQSARFSWDETAQRALRAIERQVAQAAPVAPAPGRAELIAALVELPGMTADHESLFELAFSMAAMPNLQRPPQVLVHLSPEEFQDSTPGALVLSHAGEVWHYRAAPEKHDGPAGPVRDLYSGDTLTRIDLASVQVALAAADGLYDHLQRRGVLLHCRADARLLALAPAQWMATLLTRAELIDCDCAEVAQLVRDWLGPAKNHTPQIVLQTPVVSSQLRLEHPVLAQEKAIHGDDR